MVLQQLVTLVHFILAISIIILVLLQHGKGADVGAAFGSGASNTFFGSAGSGSFLYKATWILALGFCITSISLTYFASTQHKHLLPGVPKQQISQPASNSDVPSKK